MRLARMTAVFACLLVANVARAGLLNGHANSYNDGFTTWTGSTPFATGTLSGYVDWAVFAPGAFPYAGYSPGSGEVTYAYQVFSTGTAPISAFSVALANPAGNIGTFGDLPGDAATSSVLTPFVSADWTFSGIMQSGNSVGLAYSSPMAPISLFGVVVDTGQSTFVIPLPSPGSGFIPEPGVVGVFAFAAVAGLVRRARRA